VLWLVAAGFTPVRFLRLRRVPLSLIGLGAAIGLSNFFFAGSLQVLTRSLLPSELVKRFDASHLFRDASGPDLALVVIAVGLSAPLCEEIAFRGYLQTVLAARHDLPRALVFASVLFSALHLDPVGFASRIELGALFGILAVLSGSLWPAIAAHAANNLTASTLFLIAVRRQTSGGDARLWVALLGGTTSAAVTTYLVLRFRRHAAMLAPLPPLADPENPPVLLLARALRPLLWIVGAALLALATFAALDHRGAALSFIDVTMPKAELPARVPAVAMREATLERLRVARRRARAGEVEVEQYRVLRKTLWGPGGEKGKALPPLTREEIDRAFAALDGTAAPQDKTSPDASGSDGG
jgi:membrane protease YdiL (CAAX protease family)